MHDMQEVAELPEFLQERIYYHIKLRLLHCCPLLQSASPACAATLAACMSRTLSPPSHYLMHEGEVGDCMYFLVRGMVEVLVKDPERGEKMHCTLKEGSWFGEIALVKKMKRTASVRTITVCELFRLDSASFYEVLKRFPEFEALVNEAVEERLEGTRDDPKTLSLGLLDSPSREAEAAESEMSAFVPRSGLVRNNTKKWLRQEIPTFQMSPPSDSTCNDRDSVAHTPKRAAASWGAGA